MGRIVALFRPPLRPAVNDVSTSGLHSEEVGILDRTQSRGGQCCAFQSSGRAGNSIRRSIQTSVLKNRLVVPHVEGERGVLFRQGLDNIRG